MKSLGRITSRLPELLLLALVLALAPAALASNTWYVDGVNGSDNNDCKSPQTACKTIGHAISLASSGDTIMVARAIYTENLTISISLKIIGSGAKTTIIDGGQKGSVVTISSNAQVRLAKVTIQDGASSSYWGGGIFNVGTLTISNSTISGNSASESGGGISNGGTLTISNSTISGNSASVDGGGILNDGTLTVNKSTISGNTGGYGGGIHNAGGTVTVNNSTLSGNSAGASGGGICNIGTLTISSSTVSGNGGFVAGGIYNYPGDVAALQNSIVANNSGGNCNGTMTSNGYNLSDDNTCSFTGPGDMNNTKPKLGKFGSHGGPTQTIPLLKNSPAIDAGNPNGCTDGNGNLLKTDQRGKPRPDKEDTSGCDIGAYERQSD